MSTPDWSTIELNPGVHRESVADPDRILLWIPDANQDGPPMWKRAGNTPGEPFLVEPGVFASPASLIELQETRRGLVGQLLGRLRGETDDDAWLHPDGQATKPVGDRTNDWLLVFADEETPLDDDLIRSRWPEATAIQRIGPRFVLVGGVEVDVETPDAEPLELAEHGLAAARQSGDPAQLVAALTDLGIACRGKKKAAEAVQHLDEALALCRDSEDQQRELDVQVNLGIALLELGEHSRAEESLDQALRMSRQLQDRFQEKAVLTYQAQLRSLQTDHHGAVKIYGEAFEISDALGDRSHSAKLLWDIALQLLKTQQFHAALDYGEQSVERMRDMRHPDAVRFRKQLDDFRQASGIMKPETDPAEIATGLDDLFSHLNANLPRDHADAVPENPSLLGMAASAASAAGKAVSSGFQRVDRTTRQNRLRTCSVCEHHTGIRCKLCGCFTSVKSWLPFAECPIGKWGGEDES